MKLSVVIVNYNVEFFLEQCLISVFKALEFVDGEVFVVDNNSIDGSVEMVRQKFPQVILIDNKTNYGFSKANNQALKIAKGEYHLLLNPDTIVEEDTLKKVVDFMDAHPEAGGLGVKMIDGKGNFLPESKRGLPTPGVAFYKIFGLSRLFPKSKLFGRYHLSYLDLNQTHEIEILSGAFMLMRKETLDKVGLLDEAFFMYGEDIDLSYRIILGGYKNYYYPETRIIHYKGESTKKGSINYVFVFYNAMIIFARKHFSNNNARVFSFLINLAIYFRAGLALLNRAVKKSAVPLLDITAIVSGLFLIAHYYQQSTEIIFPDKVLKIGLTGYTLIWFFTALFSGVYDKPSRLKNSVFASLLGTAIILVAYALLPKEYQFSRLIILAGGGFVLFYLLLSRYFFHLTIPGWRIGGAKNKRFLIAGDEQESERVELLLKQTNSKIQSVEFVSNDSSKSAKKFAGSLNQLEEIVQLHKIDEVIFCAKNISSAEIISAMMNLEGYKVDFKIAQPETSYLIGSNSIDTQGDLYVMDLNKIDKAANQRNKRLFDFVSSFFFVLLSPFMIWMYRDKSQFMKNIFGTLFGNYSWVGYTRLHHSSSLKLPQIKKGILTSSMLFNDQAATEEMVVRNNLIYAKNHSVVMDAKILFKNLRSLDRKPY